jgi:hypothetical protein
MTISVLIIQTGARGFAPGGCAIFAVPEGLPWPHLPRAGGGSKQAAGALAPSLTCISEGSRDPALNSDSGGVLVLRLP